MKRKILGSITTVAMAAMVLAGCGQSASTEEAATQDAAVEEAVEEEAAEEVSEEVAEESAEEATEEASEEADESAEESEEATDLVYTGEEEDTATDEESEATVADSEEYEVARVGSLKGPTTMGLVNLMNASDNGEAIGTYEFTMVTQPDELIASMVSGDIDIAMIPANVAAVLYNKTEGGISLVDINTLGVLYCVTGDESISSVADLAGKTVITTGQGATPEYAMTYLLEKNGITDCTLEFKSEATEIAAVLQEDPTKIAVLPQPFVTVAKLQNDALKTAFSLTDEWKSVSDDSQLITGVTVVRNDYLKDHAEEVANFLKEHEVSAAKAVSDVEGTAELVASYGIIEKKEIAAKAIPECYIVCISGDEAKTSLSGYLQTLFDANPKSVGGALPGDNFYQLSAE